jgi:uncharacterized membrane protein
LFLSKELTSIDKYVNNGGNLLLTTSSGGDFDYKGSRGSIRALFPVTGVIRFYWGELYSKLEEDYYLTPNNLIITNLPNHPIFEGIKKIILADTTFFELSTESNVNSVLKTNKGTCFNYYLDNFNNNAENETIIAINTYGEGKSLTIGSTLFMTNNEKYGIHLADNGKFFKNIINWLID